MVEYQHDGVTVRTSEESDIEALKNRLRDADEKESIAAGNASGEDSLRQSYARSTMRYTVDYQGIPVAMFGIVPDSVLGTRANVWFLGAPEMSKIKKTFMKLSLHYIHRFLGQYPVLWNLVDCRYTQTFKWLDWCGAQFHHKTITLNGIEFRAFKIVRA